MESAYILCRGEEILPEHFPSFLPRKKGGAGKDQKPFTLHLDGRGSINFNEMVQGFEDAMILWALSQAGG